MATDVRAQGLVNVKRLQQALAKYDDAQGELLHVLRSDWPRGAPITWVDNALEHHGKVVEAVNAVRLRVLWEGQVRLIHPNQVVGAGPP